MSSVLLAQEQIGSDINGEGEQEQSGAALSLSSDGSRLAIGARWNDGSGNLPGHARVYQWSGVNWTQLGSDIDGEAFEDASGGSVSLSSDGIRLAVGAKLNDGNGLESGHVRVYQWSGVAWEKLGADIDGESAGDMSGNSVSMSSDGSRLAIGAYRNSGSGYHAGHVRVYRWTGEAWTQLGADIDGEGEEDQSGAQVSLSSDGNRLAIGSLYNDGNGMDSGHVRVYQWSGAVWTQLGADIDGEAPGDHAGWASLSSDGSRLAIGATRNDGNGEDSGHVRVYQWSGVTWTQLGADMDGESADDGSGGAVSLSFDGNRLAIGATGNSDSGIRAGHVRVYDWSGENWTQLGADIDGAAAGDLFGSAVSLSSIGNRVAVGAPRNEDNGTWSGQVRVFGGNLFDSVSINVGHSGAWFNAATSGQGQLIDIDPANRFMFTAWFTYTHAGAVRPFEQHWFTAQGNYMGNRAELTVYETLGGKFDNPQPASTNAVGTAILSFSDCSHGQMTYSIDTLGLSGSFPMQRAIPGSENICEQRQANTTQSVDINAGMDGAWFDENTPGQGYLIDAHPNPDGGNFIFLAWFTYGDDTASGLRWLTAQGDFEGTSAEIDIYETTGGGFNDPTPVVTVKAGTLTLDFQDCNNALLTYSLADEALLNSIVISRVIPGAQAFCEELAGANQSGNQ